MNENIDWKALFITADGRLPRTPFVVAAVSLFLIMLVYDAMPSTVHWLSGWLIYPAGIFFAACILSKRLHDRGRSGWYAALIICALVGVWSSLNSVLDFVFLLVLVWAGVELGALSGEPGANRFGPNPRAQQPA